jgi:hypothetical protein
VEYLGLVSSRRVAGGGPGEGTVRRKPVDNSTLERWRGLDCVAVLRDLADHLKQDKTFAPRERLGATRWHVGAAGFDFELLCTGPRFFDTRAEHGGGGAIDLVMHVFRVDFSHAVAMLHDKGL